MSTPIRRRACILVVALLGATQACASPDRPAPEPRADRPDATSEPSRPTSDAGARESGGSIGAAAAASEGEIRAGRPNPPEWIREARRRYPGGIDFLGEDVVLSGARFDETEIGGLSGITYAGDNRYLVVSDDRGQHGPGRYYTALVRLDDGLLDPGDVVIENLTVLLDERGEPLRPGTFDTEGISRAEDGSVYVSSEGEPRAGIQPFVAQFDPGGGLRRRLPIPDKLLVEADRGETGVRRNLALESLTLTPDGRWLFTATENALRQDGPEADTTVGSPCRILKIDLESGETVAEYVYLVEPIGAHLWGIESFRTAGLVDLVALDESHLLALERSFVSGVGFDARIWWVCLDGADDVAGLDGLDEARADGILPVDKVLLFALSDLQIRLDNLEGLTLGPRLGDGRQALVMVSDNNFNPAAQMTQFLALGVPFPLTPPCDHRPGPAASPQ